MYSMVMLMAMSTAPDITTHGGGYSCTGCIGSSCHGSSCHGSSCNGLFGGMKSHGSSCHGSSCHGSSCTGCDGGSCHGCKGGGGFLGMRKMFGGMGKHKNSCNGGSCHGCTGGGSSCHGCTGGMAYPVVEHPVVVHPAPEAPCATAPLAPVHGAPVIHSTPETKIVTPEPKKMPELKKEEPKKMPEVPVVQPKKTTLAPAKIELNVPANAKVSLNGLEVAGTSEVRYFLTRELDQNTTEVYNVAVEVVRNGKTLTATEKLTVKGGETTAITVNPIETNLVSK